MSYYYAEKLDMFADLATCGEPEEENYCFWDSSDPNNIRVAGDYLDNELGFLSSGDKHALTAAWKAATEDCRDSKLLFNVVKVLKEKYVRSANQSFYC